MAETTVLREGGQTLLYAAATAPTDADDPTDAAYKVIGLQKSHNRTSTAASVEGRNKRVAAVLVSSSNTSTYAVSCDLSRTDDDGQNIIQAAFDAAPKTELYFLEYPAESGAKGRRFRGRIQSINETSADQATETLEFTIAVSTAFTAVTAA